VSNPFTSHPNSVNETYWQHFAFALRFGLKMTVGGIAAVLHAVFPFLFITTASRYCDELQAMRQNSPGRRRATDQLIGGSRASKNLQ
jgi:hypothetical protein